MHSVWVFEIGNYSDCSIEGVFSSRENAYQAYYLSHDDEKHEPREYVMDDPDLLVGIPTEYEIGKLYGVWIDLIDGSIHRYKNATLVSTYRHPTRCETTLMFDDTVIEVYSPHSAEHAKKLAVEQRQKWLRENTQ